MSEVTQSTASGLDLDLSGRQIGDYRLLRRLGRGAMAEVYLAEQIRCAGRWRSRFSSASWPNDATYVRRFHMEAQAAASLVHANIVQIHEVGCVDGMHYIAQEYVAGAESPRDARPPRAARCQARRVDHAAGRRGPGKGRRTGDRPSRHQAREHHDHRRRAR